MPAKFIININQTPLPFVLISNYTLAENYTCRVSVPGTSDYRQINGTFGVTIAGEFLPIQLTYEGKTKRCQAKCNFPKEFHITQAPNHWANEETSIAMLIEFLIPYIEGKRKEWNLQRKPWLLICNLGVLILVTWLLIRAVKIFFASRSPKLVLTRNS